MKIYPCDFGKNCQGRSFYWSDVKFCSQGRVAYFWIIMVVYIRLLFEGDLDENVMFDVRILKKYCKKWAGLNDNSYICGV